MGIADSSLGFIWLIIITIIAINGWQKARRTEREFHAFKNRQLESSLPVSPDKTVTSPTSPEAQMDPDRQTEINDEPIIESVNQTASIIPAVTKSESLKPDDISIESKLASKWLVWLGAATIALGSVFLVKYSIEQGFLKPIVRITIGILIGFGLIFGGEWLRRRPLQKAIVSIQPSYIPMALSGAGICAIYANIFAAQSLYSLITPLWGFAFLALASFGTVALSLLQGPFIAAMGISGAFFVPALISTGSQSPWGFFSYIFLITCSGLGVIRYMNWRWLAWVTLAGALIWPMLWMFNFGSRVAPLPISIYLAMSYAGFYLLNPTVMDNKKISFKDSMKLHLLPRSLFPLIVCAVGVAFYTTVVTDLIPDSTSILSTLVAVIASFLLISAYRDARLNSFLILAAILVLIVLASWDMPLYVDVRPALVLGDVAAGMARGPIIPPQLVDFAMSSVGFSVLLGIGCFIGSRRAQHPAFWTTISAIVPLLALIIAYKLILEFNAHLGWAAASLALASIFVIAASYILRKSSLKESSGEIASYAVATTAALALAMTMSLRESWLTVAISLMVPGIALIYQRLKLPALRQIAAILAGVVFARLVVNPNVIDYPIGDIFGLNWILYSYGIPAIAFYWSAKKFRADIDDRVVAILDAGALIFAVLLISLEIRHFVNDGPIDVLGYSLFEQSLQSLAWLAGAYGLYRQQAKRADIVRFWGFRLLAGLAIAQIVFLQIFNSNPLFTGDSVWEATIFNLLFFAYGLPAMFALMFFLQARRQQDMFVMKFSGIAALILAFITLSLEIRQMFQGEFIGIGLISNAELYAYSVAWLIYAGLLLTFGIKKQSRELRHASLVLVLLTVSKVFLWDMAELEGLYRVGSFFALGGSLVGIGYVYQRFLLKIQA